MNGFVAFCLTLYLYFSKGAFGLLSKGNIHEYCQGEIFAPSCRQGEVIVMNAARYGHIQVGRCLDTDLGYLGCEVNELSYLDGKCSGKMECSVVIGDTIMGKDLPCSSSLLRYLEASFTCVKVFPAEDGSCTASSKLSARSRIQYIASQTTLTSGCGEETSPWIIEAKPGQHINISLIDFKWKSERSPLKCPLRYGYIIDTTENTVIDICGGSLREKHVYLSKGNQIQLVVDKSILSELGFLLSYQAIGCPTFTNPKNTWMKEADDVITVGCHHNSRQWKMRCIGNNWIGLMGDCTHVKEKADVIKSNNDDEKMLGMQPVVAFSLLGSVFVIIACVTVTFIIGIFCIRKPKHVQNEYYLSPQPTADHTLLGTSTLSPAQPVIRTLVRIQPENTMRNNSYFPTGAGSQETRQDQNPNHFVLENRDNQLSEPIYDAVYQNT